MLRFSPFVAGVLVALGCGGSAKVTPLTPKEITRKTKPAVVRVLVYSGSGAKEPERIGSGFIVRSEGHIVTNLHVFTDVRKGVFTDVRIGLLDGRVLPVRRVVAIDPGRDLAVLAVDAQDLPTVRLGDSDTASAGDPVVAIGHPVGQYYTVSDGLISSWRNLRGRDGESTKVLQISAPISVGSSGGPLFNEYGQVIGVNTAIAREGQNLNFAVPSNYLRPLVTQRGGITLAEFATRFAPPKQSKIVRRVPEHQPSQFTGCNDQSLVMVQQAIQDAIRVGAPLYNKGNTEACFRIYETTHNLIEQNQNVCQPVRAALGQGLLRATTLEDYRAKAWALRDSFDGLLILIHRRGVAPAGAPAGTPGPGRRR